MKNFQMLTHFITQYQKSQSLLLLLISPEKSLIIGKLVIKFQIADMHFPKF